MVPHSSTLAWKIPWMEEPGRLQPMGSLSGTWLRRLSVHECIGEGNGNPLQYSCLLNSIVVFPSPPAVCHSSSVWVCLFVSSLMTLIPLINFAKNPSIWICLVFSHDCVEVMPFFFCKNSLELMLCLSQNVTSRGSWCQCVFLLMM